MKVGKSMRKSRESIKQMFVYKKTFVTILVIVSVLMSSTTFAFWSTSISGNSDEVSMTFMLTNDYYIKKYFDLNNFMSFATSNICRGLVILKFLIVNYLTNLDFRL